MVQPSFQVFFFSFFFSLFSFIVSFPLPLFVSFFFVVVVVDVVTLLNIVLLFFGILYFYFDLERFDKVYPTICSRCSLSFLSLSFLVLFFICQKISKVLDDTAYDIIRGRRKEIKDAEEHGQSAPHKGDLLSLFLSKVIFVTLETDKNYINFMGSPLNSIIF